MRIHVIFLCFSQSQRSNITVIQVSNKGPPHTAIPVLGETDVFDFNFKQNVQIKPDFVNIVHTEQNDYGTVFEKPDSEYGHLSLTTTVSVTRPENVNSVQDNSVTNVNTVTNVKSVNVNSDTNVNGVSRDGVYERLCMASTSNASPLPIRRLQNVDKVRKSSLPNLDLSESTYECLFPSQVSSLSMEVNSQNNQNWNVSKSIIPISRVIPKSNDSSAPISNSNSAASNCGSVVPISNTTPNSNMSSCIPISNYNVSNSTVPNSNLPCVSNVRNLNNGSRSIMDSHVMGLSNIERSHSQNAYDVAPGLRERRRLLNSSPKRETKKGK